MLACVLRSEYVGIDSRRRASANRGATTTGLPAVSMIALCDPIGVRKSIGAENTFAQDVWSLAEATAELEVEP